MEDVIQKRGRSLTTLKELADELSGNLPIAIILLGVSMLALDSLAGVSAGIGVLFAINLWARIKLLKSEKKKYINLIQTNC